MVFPSNSSDVEKMKGLLEDNKELSEPCKCKSNDTIKRLMWIMAAVCAILIITNGGTVGMVLMWHSDGWPYDVVHSTGNGRHSDIDNPKNNMLVQMPKPDEGDGAEDDSEGEASGEVSYFYTSFIRLYSTIKTIS